MNIEKELNFSERFFKLHANESVQSPGEFNDFEPDPRKVFDFSNCVIYLIYNQNFETAVHESIALYKKQIKRIEKRALGFLRS
jgi:hypothetical protein